MTRDDIIRMAREANLMSVEFSTALEEMWVGQLERFANLVAAAERKHCLDWCAAYASDDGTAQKIAESIRISRGRDEAN